MADFSGGNRRWRTFNVVPDLAPQTIFAAINQRIGTPFSSISSRSFPDSRFYFNSTGV
jgi:hypothetical protein